MNTFSAIEPIYRKHQTILSRYRDMFRPKVSNLGYMVLKSFFVTRPKIIFFEILKISSKKLLAKKTRVTKTV